MERVIGDLSRHAFDIAIIGGGIYGASLARDAALRGMTVALVDQGDFANATSANHGRIVHGGLRYLQHGDFARMRHSIEERRHHLRTAPHLVRPLPFMVPCYRGLRPGKALFGLALGLNDLISFDRNRGLARSRQIPAGRLLSRADCLALCPLIENDDLYAGGLYSDAQFLNPERLTLSILRSACVAGAKLANYVRVTQFLRQDRAVTGIRGTDLETGSEITIRARLVVNCAGPWIAQTLELLAPDCRPFGTSQVKGMLFVTRPLVKDVAVMIPARESYRDPDAILQKGYRNFSIVPWQNKSLIGGYHIRHEGSPDEGMPTERDIEDFLHMINAAVPSVHLDRKDVLAVYGGLLTGDDRPENSDGVSCRKHYEIRDHEVVDNVPGLVSVLGVKFTTARGVAEKAVDLLLTKLGRRPVQCLTAETPVWGGEMEDPDRFLDSALEAGCAGVAPATIRHLAENYGTHYREVLNHGEHDKTLLEPLAASSPVIGAQVIHGIRTEMARTLGDILFRRTLLGSERDQNRDVIARCADIMARELKWSSSRRDQEQKAVHEIW